MTPQKIKMQWHTYNPYSQILDLKLFALMFLIGGNKWFWNTSVWQECVEYSGEKLFWPFRDDLKVLYSSTGRRQCKELKNTCQSKNWNLAGETLNFTHPKPHRNHPRAHWIQGNFWLPSMCVGTNPEGLCSAKYLGGFYLRHELNENSAGT